MKHKAHKKKQLYARDQGSGAKQWTATEIYLCDCGAILEKKLEARK